MVKNKIINIFIAFISLIIVSCVGKVPGTIGNYTDCPEEPNCVSTKNSYSKTILNQLDM